MELIKTTGLKKTYGDAGKRVEVLKGIDLVLEKGSTVAVVGASGVGKSTLLNILGALDRPTSGDVFYNGEPIFRYDDRKLAAFRNRYVGFVFQFHHLLPEFTALENVMLPLLIGGADFSAASQKAARLLAEVGLEARVNHKPGELSRRALRRGAAEDRDSTRPHTGAGGAPCGRAYRQP